MKEKSKAYFAGVVDAEGCIFLGRKRNSKKNWNYTYSFSVTNKSKLLMEWVVEHFGGSFQFRKNSTSFRYDWCIYKSSHIQRILDQIHSYLLVKANESEVLQEYLKLKGIENPSLRYSLMRRIRRLKHQDCVTTNTLSVLPKKKVLGSYCAGLLDGDGSIIVHLNKHRTQRSTVVSSISIQSASNAAVHIVKNQFGGKVWFCPKRNKKQRHNYALRITRKIDKEKFLLAVIPHLLIKDKTAKLLLQLLRLGSSPSVYQQRLNLLSKIKIESELYK